MIYIVEVIKYDEKGKKTTVEERVEATSYAHDEHNNLTFYDAELRFICEYHTYNYIKFAGEAITA